ATFLTDCAKPVQDKIMDIFFLKPRREEETLMRRRRSGDGSKEVAASLSLSRAIIEKLPH
ncbi:hypothetical protein PIB30_112953, partial [Stylosanthes scabra]|nr:hypothetical protein [Stylosanthes scabra]